LEAVEGWGVQLDGELAQTVIEQQLPTTTAFAEEAARSGSRRYYGSNGRWARHSTNSANCICASVPRFQRV
jgi:hypothetical protein